MNQSKSFLPNSLLKITLQRRSTKRVRFKGERGGVLTGAMILGILGGIFGLFIGMFGYGLGAAAGAGTFQLISIAIPIASIVGGGMVKGKTVIGAGLMALSTVGMFFIFGFNFFTAIPLVLTALGAVLGFVAMNEGKEVAKA
jgi:hypothetical protein